MIYHLLLLCQKEATISLDLHFFVVLSNMALKCAPCPAKDESTFCVDLMFSLLDRKSSTILGIYMLFCVLSFQQLGTEKMMSLVSKRDTNLCQRFPMKKMLPM